MTDDRALTEALLGRPIDDLVGLPGGGNNRLFQVSVGAERFAMKQYDARDGSGRERFLRETTAARFLARTDLADRVPGLVAADETACIALFDWIDGVSLEVRGDDAFAQMIGFVADLCNAGAEPSAGGVDSAAEACLSSGELVRQIDRRRDRLGQIDDEPALATYLNQFDRIWRPLRFTLAEHDALLPPAYRILSPSDFGFHNALRRPDDRLVFLDFEYFGWDDPAKLTADILWHPGMMLDDGEAALVRRALGALFGRRDPGFADRLARVLPVYGLRWCLILLNEFLPERWARRRQARDLDEGQWSAAKRRQLGKAEQLIARVEACRAESLQ